MELSFLKKGNNNFNQSLQILESLKKKLMRLEKTAGKCRLNRKTYALMNEISEFSKNQKKKVIVFVMTKYILCSLHLIFRKEIPDAKISIVMSKRGKKSIVSKLPHRKMQRKEESKFGDNLISSKSRLSFLTNFSFN